MNKNSYITSYIFFIIILKWISMISVVCNKVKIKIFFIKYNNNNYTNNIQH